GASAMLASPRSQPLPGSSTMRTLPGLAAGLSLLPILPALASAQEAPPPSFEVARAIDSGWASNGEARERTIVSFPVQVAGASWLRLSFGDVVLPEVGAHLVITSVLDGAQQVLTARTCREWGSTSAYFNGDDAQVEVAA